LVPENVILRQCSICLFECGLYGSTKCSDSLPGDEMKQYRIKPGCFGHFSFVYHKGPMEQRAYYSRYVD